MPWGSYCRPSRVETGSAGHLALFKRAGFGCSVGQAGPGGVTRLSYPSPPLGEYLTQKVCGALHRPSKFFFRKFIPPPPFSFLPPTAVPDS